MKRQLKLIIDAGEKTCASEPGKFCPWLRTTHMGFQWVCGLFDGKEVKAEPNPDDWLQRLPECIEAENNLTDTFDDNVNEISQLKQEIRYLEQEIEYLNKNGSYDDT